MEAAGIEPASCNDATSNTPYACVNCQHWRAANALHSGGFQWPELASVDVELQRVITAWGDLPEAIRRAVSALVGSQ